MIIQPGEWVNSATVVTFILGTSPSTRDPTKSSRRQSILKRQMDVWTKCRFLFFAASDEPGLSAGSRPFEPIRVIEPLPRITTTTSTANTVKSVQVQ